MELKQKLGKSLISQSAMHLLSPSSFPQGLISHLKHNPSYHHLFSLFDALAFARKMSVRGKDLGEKPSFLNFASG